MSKKVLLSGDVQGNFHALFKRVAAVNKANGPFDLLLCAGSFTPGTGTKFRFAAIELANVSLFALHKQTIGTISSL